MRIKLHQIYTSWPILQKIATFEIDASSAIRLHRFLAAAQNDYNLIDDQRQKLVRKHGKPTADIFGEETWQVEKADEPAFWADFAPVLANEVEIYDPQLSSQILEGQKLSAADFFGVAWLFDREPVIKLTGGDSGANADHLTEQGG